MTELTEGRHTAEFILSEANGSRSRENGTLAMGEDLEAGTVLMDNGSGKLVEFDAATDSSGDLVKEAAGILLAKTNATADTKVAYLARDAEVNLKLLTHPTGTGDEDLTVESLARIGIIARD